MTPFIASGWNSNFLFCHRLPHLQPALPSSTVVGSHMLRRPHSLMGRHFVRFVHRKFRHRRSKGERSILRNIWLLVLDHTSVPSRTVYHRVPLHVRLGWVLIRPLFARLFQTSWQHQPLRWIQTPFSSTAQSQSWQNSGWHIHHDG